MRIILLLFVGTVLFTSCNKDYSKMTVVKDCTGTYLRTEQGAEYLVCNDDQLTAYTNGDQIKVKIETVNECYGLMEPVTCTQAHPNQGKIEVIDIKN